MKNKLAVQMFTLRDFTHTADDLARTLERISAMGYPAVQLSAVGAMNGENPQVNAADARRMLDDNGLKCIATHRGWQDLVDKTEQEIEFHQILGCDYVAIGSIPPAYGQEGAAGYARFVKDSAPVIARLSEAGIRFGYHNHAFEFQRMAIVDGLPRTNFDVFIDADAPGFLLELDLYWVGHSGANPQTIVERCAGRIPVIHIKDKEMDGNEPHMAPIGEGNMDWQKLVPACEAAGVEWYAIEQDVCRRDPFDCVESSFKFLTGVKF